MNTDTGLPKLKDGVTAATHLFLLLCVAVIAGFGYWAWHGSLAVVSVAEGEVVPSSQVKSIQHLEGGIVRAIEVREGDAVKKGQPLIVLESTASGADVNELRTRITSLKIEIARLTAEEEGTGTPDFGPALSIRHPDSVRDARRFSPNAGRGWKTRWPASASRMRAKFRRASATRPSRSNCCANRSRFPKTF